MAEQVISIQEIKRRERAAWRYLVLTDIWATKVLAEAMERESHLVPLSVFDGERIKSSYAWIQAGPEVNLWNELGLSSIR